MIESRQVFYWAGEPDSKEPEDGIWMQHGTREYSTPPLSDASHSSREHDLEVLSKGNSNKLLARSTHIHGRPGYQSSSCTSILSYHASTSFQR